MAIKKRFLACAIASDEQSLAQRVVHREREHAIEPRQRIRPPLRICRKEDFRIAFTLERITESLKIGAQFKEVVDLAIEGDADVTVAGPHRLMTFRRQIDDGEPTMTESDPAVVR